LSLISYFCKGELVEKKISHIHSWADKLILFKQTPAEVCKQCGEVYFSTMPFNVSSRELMAGRADWITCLSGTGIFR
jgi:YgiT-type zinc finger domain-containing protein